MNVLKAISRLSDLADSIKGFVEGNEELKNKLESEGLKGRLEIEDIEVLFLIRRMKNGGSDSGN